MNPHRLPHALRVIAGTIAVGVGGNLIGALVVLLLTLAVNVQLTDHQEWVFVRAALIASAVAVVIGTVAGITRHRRTLRWLLHGIEPSAEDARRALRVPFEIAVICLVVWTLGTATVAIAMAMDGFPARIMIGPLLGTVLAALCSVGITYLLVDYVTAPVARVLLSEYPPSGVPLVSLSARLLLYWGLTTAVPVLGILLILLAPGARADNLRAAAAVLAGISVVVGLIANGLIARGLGQPLRHLVGSLQRIGAGDLRTTVPVEDPGEIGRVQHGVNEMVGGLRERERIQDLFGRHVGSAVAQQALQHGVTLEGEQREVVALFVDIAGSTQLTHANGPVQIVQMLNRFFAIVVEAVEANGGLLNKFEGDGALCVFGAPVPLDNAATCALRAARAIRDGVAAAGEVTVGIGVAVGPVVAGQIGSPTRLEYTVIGDAVNEAARLTDLAKRMASGLAASERAVQAADPDEAELWRPDGEVELRGRPEPTTVWIA